MQLPPEQTARFYRIWLALLHDVNEQLHLVPAFSATEEKNGLLPLSSAISLLLASVKYRSKTSACRLVTMTRKSWANW